MERTVILYNWKLISTRKEVTEMARNGNNKSKRGFAAMDEDEQRAIASKGGQEAHKQNPQLAPEAGHKGGMATSERHGADFYEDIGRKGGKATAEEHGPEFYKEIGKKGGQKTAETHDKKFYQEIGKKGAQARNNDESED